MKWDEYDLSPLLKQIPSAEDCSSVETSVSTQASIWSDACSQHSDDTSISAPISESDSCESLWLCRHGINAPKQLHMTQKQPPAQVEVPAELRQNPRRSCHGITTRSGCPPALVRQADRKVNFVDNLVDSSTQIVEAIWPTSSVPCRNESGNSGVLPLRTFIQETLRRSRTSYSTLQVALYYLILIKPHVPDHDFTMEQPDDSHASRALQCGRRMFLAALILASKYLQDRNYSARAWSKISGLDTKEINQNETAFLLAVNWKLHITEEVYNRWTDCVVKHTPSQPPSPGGVAQRQFERQCEDFKRIVLKLSPDLDNLDEVAPYSPSKARARDLQTLSPLALFTSTADRSSAFGYDGTDLTPTVKNFGTPIVMEPTPAAAVYTPGRLAPAFGLLPTPRLTPQTSGFNTPAVSVTSHLKGPAMGFAMTQAALVKAAQGLDRMDVSTTSSPQSYFSTRRSSLANSISTASSPESMISDTSRISRSSSISSASSLASAPLIKLDVQARCRYAKQCSERLSVRPTIASVPEDYEENCISSSPDSYTGPVGKDLCDLSLHTPTGYKERDVDDGGCDSVNDAARALQDLRRSRHDASDATAAPKAGVKRGRPRADSSLHEDVRAMLRGDSFPLDVSGALWSDSLVRPPRSEQVAVPATVQGGRKRVCCSSEASQSFISSLHNVAGGVGGPGMWEGILN